MNPIKAPVIVESTANHTLSLQLTPALPATGDPNLRLKAKGKADHPNPVYGKMGLESSGSSHSLSEKSGGWVRGWKAPAAHTFFK